MQAHWLGAALLLVCGIAGVPRAVTAADVLHLEPGKPVEIVCETRAVSVADEARATTGSIRLKLEASRTASSSDAASNRADTAESKASNENDGRKSEAAEPDVAKPPAAKPAAENAGGSQTADRGPLSGHWSIADVPASHIASFGLKQREACASAACPFEPGNSEHTIHLWAPGKVMPDKVEPGTSMSLGSLDLVSLAVRVSTFRDGAIAALEQGDCKRAP